MRWVGWTLDRLSHIWGKHRVSEEELRQALVEPGIRPVFKKSGQGRYAVFAQTSEGRNVMAFADIMHRDEKPGMIIYEIRDVDTLEGLPEKGKRGAYIVTCRDMGEAERRWFRSMVNK